MSVLLSVYNTFGPDNCVGHFFFFYVFFTIVYTPGLFRRDTIQQYLKDRGMDAVVEKKEKNIIFFPYSGFNTRIEC